MTYEGRNRARIAIGAICAQIALGVGLSACGDPEFGAGREFVSTVDSAGTAIVEAVDPWADGASRPGMAWELEPEPLLALGTAGGDPAQEFLFVSGATRLDDGTLVIANGGTDELRFFDGEGTHLRSVGRDGEGPGEFRNLGWVAPYRGDSIAVFDRSIRRITIFDGEGALGRTLPLATFGEGLAPGAIGPFDDGGFLLYASERATPSLPPGLTRLAGELIWIGADGSPRGSRVAVPGEEWF